MEVFLIIVYLIGVEERKVYCDFVEFVCLKSNIVLKNMLIIDKFEIVECNFGYFLLL